MRVSVVIPALNEARNIGHVLARLPRDVDEVLLVDGHSTDGTVALAKRHRPDIVVVHQNRRGKGNALACGVARARGDIVVTVDADGSNDPAEIPRYVDALLRGADFAKGSRFLAGGGSSDLTRLRRWGNRLLTSITNAVFGARYTDLCYGYNAFWRRCVTALALDTGTAQAEDEPMRWGDGFEIETLMNVRAAKNDLRVVEVPSFERSRMHGRSNLNAFSDGLRVLRTIVVERWSWRAEERIGDLVQLSDAARARDEVTSDLLHRTRATS